MAEFTVNTARFDPYKSFMFRVKFVTGGYVAGLSRMGPLKRTTEPVTHRVGGAPSRERKSPGRTRYDAVTLERGLTHDLAFEEWADLVHAWGSVMSLAGFRRDLHVDVYNEAGQLALRYNLFGCWVSEYTALPQLDAGTSAVAIESIRIELDGWERDAGQKEPTET